jgi:hypothetical protein
MDRVFTGIVRAAPPKRMVCADFAAAPALISDCDISDRRVIGSSTDQRLLLWSTPCARR